jgi:hypothetical protein
MEQPEEEKFDGGQRSLIQMKSMKNFNDFVVFPG